MAESRLARFVPKSAPPLRPESASGITWPGIKFTLMVPFPAMVLIPWIITRYELQPPFFGAYFSRWIGAVLIPSGAVVYAAGIRALGRGRCAPYPPVPRIVSDGAYGWTRNPLYLGVLLLLFGQVLIFGSRGLLIYWAVWFAAFHLFERFVDEPLLRMQFGEAYEGYCSTVPMWIPRPPRGRSRPGSR